LYLYNYQHILEYVELLNLVQNE